MPVSRELLLDAAHQISNLWEGESVSEDRESISAALVEIGVAKPGTVRLWNCGISLDGIVEPGADIEFEMVDGRKAYAVVSDFIDGRVRLRIGRELTLSMYS